MRDTGVDFGIGLDGVAGAEYKFETPPILHMLILCIIICSLQVGFGYIERVGLVPDILSNLFIINFL